MDELMDLADEVCERLGGIAGWSRFSRAECHLSLSRTIYLKELHIDPLVAGVRRRIKEDGIPPRLRYWFSGIKCFENDEKTCKFLAVLVGSEQQCIERCIKAVDRVVEPLGFPVYYNV